MNLSPALKTFLVGIGVQVQVQVQVVALRGPSSRQYDNHNDDDDDASSSITSSASDINPSIIMDVDDNHINNYKQDVPIIESKQISPSQIRVNNHRNRLQFLHSSSTVLRNQPEEPSAVTRKDDDEPSINNDGISNANTNTVDIDSGHLRNSTVSVVSSGTINDEYYYEASSQESNNHVHHYAADGINVGERHLDSFDEYCSDLCEGKPRPTITKSGQDFGQLIRDCFGQQLKIVDLYGNSFDYESIGTGIEWFYEESYGDERSLIGSGNCPEYIENEVVPIGCWDTSRVTDMAYAFKGQTLNEPINCWNVKSVTDMHGMFYETTSFNKPLNGWDVSSVTNMSTMFYFAATFNQPLNDWNAASASNMGFMFYHTSNFNQCLSSWADKTPTEVYTYSMLDHADCSPNANITPDPIQGPWCQEPEQGCTIDGIPPVASLTTSEKILSGSSSNLSLTASLTNLRTVSPTASPIASPTASPTESPTASPTVSPTESPTESPTKSPTKSPTASPTASPTGSPTESPTASPTVSSTESPTASPTVSSTESPTTEVNCIDNELYTVKVGARKSKRFVSGCKHLTKNRSRRACSRGKKAQKLRKECPASCNLPRCTCKDSQFVTFTIGREKFKERCSRIDRELCTKVDKVLNSCPQRCKAKQCEGK